MDLAACKQKMDDLYDVRASLVLDGMGTGLIALTHLLRLAFIRVRGQRRGIERGADQGTCTGGDLVSLTPLIFLPPLVLPPPNPSSTSYPCSRSPHTLNLPPSRCPPC